MSYLDVITLNEAKIHLGVDDTSRDSEITRMIVSSLQQVENDTNVHVIAKDLTYYPHQGVVVVYDFPINTVVEGKKERPNYAIYENVTDSLLLNVGYQDPIDVPPSIKELAFILLEERFHKGLYDPTKEYLYAMSREKRFII